MEKRRLRVFENKVLWRIFGSKWDEVIREWRKLHNEGPTDPYSPTKYYQNIVRAIKSRGMRWAGCVAQMGERCVQGFGGKT